MLISNKEKNYSNEFSMKNVENIDATIGWKFYPEQNNSNVPWNERKKLSV